VTAGARPTRPLPMPSNRPLPTFLPFVAAVAMAATAPAQDAAPPNPNPYRLVPFHADFPAELSYPPQQALEYDRTRRQMLLQVANNLQGNVRREAWQMATEFFWRAPEDAGEPLVELMDRSMANPALTDVVKNAVEAMAKMGDRAFDVPLRRALQHKHDAVRYAAYAALCACGSDATLRELEADFVHMDSRGRAAWLRAVRERLGDDAVELLQKQMAASYHATVRDQVLKEALRMPAEQAARILRVRWDEAALEFKAIIAGVLHAAGDAAGTAWLRDALRAEDPMVVSAALQYGAFGELGPLREDFLRCSSHLRPEVRLAVARTLTRVPGSDVADVYEVLAAPDEIWEVRALALRELTRRGRGQVVSVLLEELPTATGMRLQSLLNQLGASGDDRAAAVLVERFERAPEGEGREFLQALAHNGSLAAARALGDIYRGPERRVARSASGWLTTLNYLPTLLLNLRGHEAEVLALYRSLPREDWRRRALLLPSLAGIASDRGEGVARDEFLGPVRTILFDKDELPQLRVLALNLLSLRHLTLEDALRLKNERFAQQDGMRALWNDFLFDFF
jgi:hypothetical protein